jgi:hypothetical protein
MSEQLPSERHAIVSARSMPPLPSEESTIEADTQADLDEIEKALILTRYQAMREELAKASALPGQDVMVTVQNAEMSRMQSRLAELAIAGEPLPAGGQEVKFGTGLGGGDWFGWAKSLFDWVDRKDAHPFIWSTAPPEPLSDTAKIALVGDWGTALYGAVVIADDIRRTKPFDVLMHLGDVYYSGTPTETKERFIKVWPLEAGRVSRALNANHEMYSGGYGFFDIMLPTLKQKASYFALQNQHWLLVGLDTAYIDHDLDSRQVAWLENTIADAGSRKVVLFSHQQLFSRLDNQGEKLEPKLRPLLTKKRITAWYWGHEHQCVLYDKHPQWGLIARCLGNGGIPEIRKRDVKSAPAEKTVGSVSWRRLAPTAAKPWAPSCLALDGPNSYIKGRENDFVPHGYMTLTFEGPTIKEKVLLPDGTVVFENTIE